MLKLNKLEQNVPDRPGGGVIPPTSGGGIPPRARANEMAVVVATAIAAADAVVRAAGVRASPLEAVRAAQAERERGRLAAKYGDHAPRTLAAGVRATTRAIEARSASIVAVRAQVPPVRPPPAADGSIIHGRVVDRDGRVRAGVDVAVRVDERTIVHAVSDRDGYYRVAVPAAAVAEARGRQPIVGAPARPAAVNLMASRGTRPLMRAGSALTMTGGRVLYRELVVDDDGGPVR